MSRFLDFVQIFRFCLCVIPEIWIRSPMQSEALRRLIPGFHPGYAIAASAVICRNGWAAFRFSREAISGPVTIAAEAAPTTRNQYRSPDAIRGFCDACSPISSGLRDCGQRRYL
jgi:hypothetical protein